VSIGRELVQEFREFCPINLYQQTFAYLPYSTHLLKQTVEVHMNDITSIHVKKNILAVTIPEPDGTS
jgi:hypothetical protein